MSTLGPNADDTTAQPLLDHIVILVDHHLLTGIDARLAGLFTVAPGGRHADGRTWNRLILFPDGTYIELLAFLDGAARTEHRWGALRAGAVIDWACSLREEHDFAQVRARVAGAQTGLAYGDLTPGGRERPDGTALRWAIGAAAGPDGEPVFPGALPFWCLDRTPRELRVPYRTAPELTSHPSGAKGISRVVIEAPAGDASHLRDVYRAIFDPKFDRTGENEWPFHVPTEGHGGKQTISLVKGSGEQVIQLALAGGPDSPSFVELLPGLTVKLESYW